MRAAGCIARMENKVESNASTLDSVKLALALVIVSAGVYVFMGFSEANFPALGETANSLLRLFWVRLLILLIASGTAMFVVSSTPKGSAFIGFIKDANIERRKVVWPTRQETVQTTLIILIVVVLVGILLFLIDSFFGWGIRVLVGSGG